MKRILFIFLFFFIINQFLFAQNISGVINIYVQVTNILNNQDIVVTSTTGFSVGDRVLLIQMKGATITQTNTIAYGNITAYNNAGNYEYKTIAAINASTNTITLQTQLCKNFNLNGVLQLIRVPEYTNPIVTGTLTCQAWNGTTGGVLAFNASGTVTMQANMDVSNNGFRGGAVCYQWFGCGSTSFVSGQTNCTAGAKGEGIAQFIAGQENGRGHIANGGGGSENGNNGCGGGGNFAAGGIGGNEYNGCFTTGIQGVPGELLTYNVNRIFLGGAGGGGFADNNQSVTPGGNGGGIILIKAAAIDGNNNFIRSNGQSVTTVANDEGAGGGGAGGSIFLMVNNFTSTTNIQCNGGAGGSNNNQIFTTNCHGPGGGGAGGILWLSSAALPTNVNFTATGGAAGLVLNPASTCYNTGWGAMPGGNGGIQYNLDTSIVMSVNLGNDTILCTGDSIVLNAGSNFSNYLWSNNATTQTITVTQAGTYSVTASIGAACSATDQINISFVPPSTGSLSDTVCSGNTYTLPSGTVVSAAGTYMDTIPANNGCDSIITVTLNVSPTISLQQNITICSNQTFTLPGGAIVNTSGTYIDTLPSAGCDTIYTTNLSVNQSATTYLNASICTGDSYRLPGGVIVTASGTYVDSLITPKGCDSIITTVLVVNPLPNVTAQSSTTIFSGESTTLTATGGGPYNWFPSTGLNSTTSASVIASPTQTTTYCVEVTDNNGCKDSACVTIYVNEFPCPTPDNLAVPNAFSPNADGANDEFCLQGWDLCIDQFNIRIYDRWGEKVFESNDPAFCWDGTKKGGIMDAQVFVYYIRAIYLKDAKVVSKKGNISLLR